MNKQNLIYLYASIAGLIGMMLYLSAYHAWLDHKFVDAIRDQIQNQQTQQQKK